jgi:hypothetical protein
MTTTTPAVDFLGFHYIGASPSSNNNIFKVCDYCGKYKRIHILNYPIYYRKGVRRRLVSFCRDCGVNIIARDLHVVDCKSGGYLEIEACRTGHGDIQKTVNVMEICNALSLTREQIDSQIISPLVLGGYIKGSTKDEVIVTRKGYYYAIKISGESAPNFGMVSYNEAKRLSFDILKYICKRIHGGKTESKINIVEIKAGGYEGAPDAYGKEVINQIAEILDEYGFIRLLDDNGEIEITTKGVEEVIRRIILQEH